MTSAVRDWVLGFVVFLTVGVVCLVGLLATKPSGWPLGKYALLLAVPSGVLFFVRRVRHHKAAGESR